MALEPLDNVAMAGVLFILEKELFTYTLLEESISDID